MAEKRRFLDVWIIESNTVYREVPFEIVTDWVQQGRLLPDDMLRPSGTAEWFRLGDNPSFSAYLPHAEPFAANDQAEALEPVQSDFVWKRGPHDEDDDVDMIPLIDVSLVLLVFFMMTAAVAATGFALPSAQRNLVSTDENMLWIGVHALQTDPTQFESFSVGKGSRRNDNPDFNGLPTKELVVQRLRLLVEESEREYAQQHNGDMTGFVVQVQIKADQTLPFGLIRDLQARVQAEFRDKDRKVLLVNEQFWGVTEKRP